MAGTDESVVPQITPGIVAGALIAFTMSVDDFYYLLLRTGRGVKELKYHGVYDE